MSIRFRALFTLAASHPYYKDGRPELDFVIPDATLQTFSRSKLLARVRDGRLHVLFEADETAMPIVPAAGRTLRFGVRPHSASFSNVTALPFETGVATPLYRNAASVTELDPGLPVLLTGSTLVHRITDSLRPVTLVVRNPTGQALATQTITAAHDRPVVSFDLTGQRPGRYRTEETYPGNVQHEHEYFLEPQLISSGPTGIVEVGIDASFYVSPPSFNLSFEPKEQVLKYYVVARNYSDAEVGQLAVTDLGAAVDGRPPVAFDKLLPGAFTGDDVPASVLGADAPVVLFKSQTAVARTERPRHKIQLSRNGNVLVEQLPQPGPDRPKADVIVHLSKP